MLTRRESIKLFGYTTAAIATGAMGFPRIANAKKSWEIMHAHHYGISGEADHTYVMFPEIGPDGIFDCWYRDPTKFGNMLKFYRGRYRIANCYRGNIRKMGNYGKATAKIGAYGVAGVCHQSANCFLFTAAGKQGGLLDHRVKGYAASKAAYGARGTNYHHNRLVRKLTDWGFSTVVEKDVGWYKRTWKPCYNKNKKIYKKHAELDNVYKPYRVALINGSNMKDTLNYASEDKTALAIHRANQAVFARADDGFVSTTDMIASELSALINLHMPEVETALIKSQHVEYLKEHLSHVQSGIKQDALAKKVNDLSVAFQKTLAGRLTPEQYEKLMGGVKHGDSVNIIASDLIGIAGINPEEL